MNWVAPIKDQETLKNFGETLKQVDYKYYIMFELGVGTGLQLQDILAFKNKDVTGKKEIEVTIGTRNMKNVFTVPIVGTTIPHDIVGNYGAGSVFMRPATEGTGVIAGGPARAVIELAGIKNIRTKSLGSNNKQNVVLATIEGLSQLKAPEDVAKLRGKTVEEILG